MMAKSIHLNQSGVPAWCGIGRKPPIPAVGTPTYSKKKSERPAPPVPAVGTPTFSPLSPDSRPEDVPAREEPGTERSSKRLP
jgi:hypothetical protein